MRPTFDIVAEIIALTCEVPRERITPDSNLVNDLGIDSLDLLDITFAIDDAFGIAMPIDRWLHAVHMGRISSDQYFVMRGFCANIDALIVADTA
jgi:acyl carrier protein